MDEKDFFIPKDLFSIKKNIWKIKIKSMIIFQEFNFFYLNVSLRISNLWLWNVHLHIILHYHNSVDKACTHRLDIDHRDENT